MSGIKRRLDKLDNRRENIPVYFAVSTPRLDMSDSEIEAYVAIQRKVRNIPDHAEALVIARVSVPSQREDQK